MAVTQDGGATTEADGADLRQTPVDDESPTGRVADGTTRPPGITFLQSIALFVGLVIFMALPPLAVVGTARWLSRGNGTYRAEIVLPAVLLVGVISLMAVLTIVVLIFSRLDLTSRAGALGLPDGSIQAVIALALILIFAIVGVYLHGVAGNRTVRTLSGLSRAQLDALPTGELVSQRGTGGGRWEAVIEPRNEQQDNLALQLLTTISTLVVAVAGFYFGSKSVKEATTRGATIAAAGGEAAAAGTSVGGRPPGTGAGDEEVDEASAYGERSPVTGLAQTDVEEELDAGAAPVDEDGGDDDATAAAAGDGGDAAATPAAEDGDEGDAVGSRAAGTAAVQPAAGAPEEPVFESHPDYQPEPDFYPDDEAEDPGSTGADEDAPPSPAEGDDDAG